MSKPAIFQWATNPNYATGVAVGTPTKIAPSAGQIQDGFVPQTAAIPQHVNFALDALADWAVVYLNNLHAETDFTFQSIAWGGNNTHAGTETFNAAATFNSTFSVPGTASIGTVSATTVGATTANLTTANITNLNCTGSISNSGADVVVNDGLTVTGTSTLAGGTTLIGPDFILMPNPTALINTSGGISAGQSISSSTQVVSGGQVEASTNMVINGGSGEFKYLNPRSRTIIVSPYLANPADAQANMNDVAVAAHCVVPLQLGHGVTISAFTVVGTNSTGGLQTFNVELRKHIPAVTSSTIGSASVAVTNGSAIILTDNTISDNVVDRGFLYSFLIYPTVTTLAWTLHYINVDVLEPGPTHL